MPGSEHVHSFVGLRHMGLQRALGGAEEGVRSQIVVVYVH